MTIGVRHGYSAARMMMLGGTTCFALRMVSYWQHWELPNIAL